VEFGALMFFTDYAMPAMEFAQTAEAQGFESVWMPGWPYRDSGIARVVVMLPSAKSDTILPTRDRWAELLRRVG
jgi:hypothetical protein